MKYFFFLSVLFFLVSCGDGQADSSGANQDSTSATLITDTCDCDALQIDSTGTHLLDAKLYTGTCVSYYEDGTTRYLEKNILAGKLHGKVEYFDKQGLSLLQEFYENGVQKRSGNSENGLTCNCSELKIIEIQGMSVYKLDDIPFSGKCEKYYENSNQLYMESNYKDGLLHGYTIYYNRDGSTILMEKYEMGVQASAIH